MGPRTRWDPAQDGTPHTMGPLTQWDPIHNGTPHTMGPIMGIVHTVLWLFYFADIVQIFLWFMS